MMLVAIYLIHKIYQIERNKDFLNFKIIVKKKNKLDF